MKDECDHVGRGGTGLIKTSVGVLAGKDAQQGIEVEIRGVLGGGATVFDQDLTGDPGGGQSPLDVLAQAPKMPRVVVEHVLASRAIQLIHRVQQRLHEVRQAGEV